MSDIRIKWNMAGFSALRNSPGVVADIESRGQAIANAAGDGVESLPARLNNGVRGRARVRVVTTTAESMIAEATDRTLTSAIDSGR